MSLGRYRQVEILGKGTFSVVVKAVDESTDPPELAALKLLPRGQVVRDFKTYLTREIVHQSSLRHPFIVRLREVFLTPEYLVIAMEYIPGGDVVSYVERHRPRYQLPESQARWIFQQLLIGLDYCHCKGVANRDLKLENLLLDTDGTDGRRPLLKICDFGYCKHDETSSAKSGVGTPVFMSPEVFLGTNKYDAKLADVWSCGVILFTLLLGRYPFDGNDPRFAIKVANAEFDFPKDCTASSACRDLLKRILVADPKARLGVSELLKHPWFLEDLPPGATQMNAYYLSRPPASLSTSAQRTLSELLTKAEDMGQANEGGPISILL